MTCIQKMANSTFSFQWPSHSVLCMLSKHMVCNEVGSQTTKAQFPFIHTVKQSKFSVTHNFTDTWGLIRKFTNNISFPCCSLQSIPSQPKTGSPASVSLLEALANILCLEIWKCCLQLFLNHASVMPSYSTHCLLQFCTSEKSNSGPSGEHRWCKTTVLSLLDRHWCTDTVGWAVSLLQWRNKAPVHHFSDQTFLQAS
jgi:hypothetical protein